MIFAVLLVSIIPGLLAGGPCHSLCSTFCLPSCKCKCSGSHQQVAGQRKHSIDGNQPNLFEAYTRVGVKRMERGDRCSPYCQLNCIPSCKFRCCLKSSYMDPPRRMHKHKSKHKHHHSDDTENLLSSLRTILSDDEDENKSHEHRKKSHKKKAKHKSAHKKHHAPHHEQQHFDISTASNLHEQVKLLASNFQAAPEMPDTLKHVLKLSTASKQGADSSGSELGHDIEIVSSLKEAKQDEDSKIEKEAILPGVGKETLVSEDKNDKNEDMPAKEETEKDSATTTTSSKGDTTSSDLMSSLPWQDLIKSEVQHGKELKEILRKHRHKTDFSSELTKILEGENSEGSSRQHSKQITDDASTSESDSTQESTENDEDDDVDDADDTDDITGDGDDDIKSFDDIRDDDEGSTSKIKPKMKNVKTSSSFDHDIDNFEEKESGSIKKLEKHEGSYSPAATVQNTHHKAPNVGSSSEVNQQICLAACKRTCMPTCRFECCIPSSAPANTEHNKIAEAEKLIEDGKNASASSSEESAKLKEKLQNLVESLSQVLQKEQSKSQQVVAAKPESSDKQENVLIQSGVSKQPVPTGEAQVRHETPQVQNVHKENNEVTASHEPQNKLTSANSSEHVQLNSSLTQAPSKQHADEVKPYQFHHDLSKLHEQAKRIWEEQFHPRNASSNFLAVPGTKPGSEETSKDGQICDPVCRQNCLPTCRFECCRPSTGKI